ncbi:MAG: hypothetical protein FJX54_13440 [Alphaproteobacteria bacterium]|nr:hypothetical protein [Alphaproteobacteria bacterium]
MALKIETFSNVTGSSALFKALGHPLAQPGLSRLVARLAAKPAVALYDPFGFAPTLAELCDLAPIKFSGVFVQDVTHIGREVAGCRTEPVLSLAGSDARAVLVCAFDSERVIGQIRHLVPRGAEVLSLDIARLPSSMLTNARTYLDPLNFATNLVFFRDDEEDGGHHTRLVTANYWSGYGAAKTTLWLRLYDTAGKALAEWQEELKPGTSTIVIDSKDVRRRFGLKPFCGQVFLHAIGVAGHDVIKYALDTYGDTPSVLSCTHDANSFPADFYAGLPAPDKDERVVLWVQNAHPIPIPPKGVGLNAMGRPEIAWIEEEVPPFGTAAVDVGALLPAVSWPDQIEIRAGRHVVRPRYEVTREHRTRIAHVNVERTDLKPDPKIAELGNLFGKGFILPAPILPRSRYRSLVQPTPMGTTQMELPAQLLVVDPDGKEVARRALGRLRRAESIAIEVDEMLGGIDLLTGHVELTYDFAQGGEADGWLHALFRYVDRSTGHAADTSFGAHMFNTALVYKGEPQSYTGRPPGLSTRLFLRLGPDPLDTYCHLIYPASTPWHPLSSTEVALHRSDGHRIASRHIAIPCGGSRSFRIRETFSAEERHRAGVDAYVVVRDTTCRLFGYHGLISTEAFSLDHMFGF